MRETFYNKDITEIRLERFSLGKSAANRSRLIPVTVYISPPPSSNLGQGFVVRVECLQKAVLGGGQNVSAVRKTAEKTPRNKPRSALKKGFARVDQGLTRQKTTVQFIKK